MIGRHWWQRLLGQDDQGPGDGGHGPLDDYWYRPLVTASQTGVFVSPQLAMEVSPVFACVKVISETFAMLPLITYERVSPKERQRAIDHPVYDLLHEAPNLWQSPYDFKECLSVWAALHGNGYARKIFDSRGVVRQLIPIHPSLVQIEVIPADVDMRVTLYDATSASRLETGAPIQLRYQVRQPNGTRKAYLQNEMLHVRGLSLDGISGAMISNQAKETIGLARSMEAYGARYFNNDATIGLMLEHPGTLSKLAHQRLKESFATEYAGVRNAWKPKVLEEGLKLTRMTNSGKDAQLTDARATQVVEICRYFRMPPHKIQDLLHATFSNIEHQAIEFVSDTMQPWATRWEQAAKRDLLNGDPRYFIETLMQGLLRGDSAARATYYKERFYMGTLSRNDIRELEGENPITGGDTYYVNSATVPLDALGNPRPAERISETGVAAPLKPVPPAQIPSPDDSTAQQASFTVLLREAADRIAGAEYRAAQSKRVTSDEVFFEYADRVLGPLCAAWFVLGGKVPTMSWLLEHIPRRATLPAQELAQHAQMIFVFLCSAFMPSPLLTGAVS